MVLDVLDKLFSGTDLGVRIEWVLFVIIVFTEIDVAYIESLSESESPSYEKRTAS
jgi:hypothetical protein